ncbi:MAG: ORF6N domain-containing protein [Bryobacteraceae bacterium]
MTEKKSSKTARSHQGASAYHVIRGRMTMLESDAARLYDVPVADIREVVAQHPSRFPKDFRFKLTKREAAEAQAPFEPGAPFAFTESGLAMLATLLPSKRAVEASVRIVRSCLAVREIAVEHRELGQEIQDLKRRQRDQRAQLEEMSTIMNRIFPVVTARRQPTLTSLN